MTARSHDVLKDALQLPAADRAELAAQLIESLDPESDADAAAAWRAEAQRRAAEIDRGAVQPIPWVAARPMVVPPSPGARSTSEGHPR